MLRLKSNSTTPLYIFLWLICSPILIYSQSGVAKSLEIGNKWVYHIVSHFTQYYRYDEVVGDTLIDQKTYAIIKSTHISNIYYSYQRADSIRIYQYVPDDYSAREDTLVNFRLNVGDSLDGYLYKDKSNIYYYDKDRLSIHIYLEIISLWYDDVHYLEGVGIFKEIYGGHALAGDEITSELKAAQIEEKMYGDSTLLDVKESTNYIPSEFKIYQNYPNPFNPVTTIQYEIPSLEHVSIIIYDILGRQVAVLVAEQKSAGSYHIEFNAHSLPSGVYYYRMQAGLFSETKKLVLLK